MKDVRHVACIYRDPRHHLGYGMKMLQAALKRERVSKAA
jgi:hypothetical protein